MSLRKFLWMLVLSVAACVNSTSAVKLTELLESPASYSESVVSVSGYLYDDNALYLYISPDHVRQAHSNQFSEAIPLVGSRAAESIANSRCLKQFVIVTGIFQQFEDASGGGAEFLAMRDIQQITTAAGLVCWSARDDL